MLGLAPEAVGCLCVCVCVCVCLCSHHLKQIGHQPGLVAIPSCGQLERENEFPFLSWRLRIWPRNNKCACTVARPPARSPHPGYFWCSLTSLSSCYRCVTFCSSINSTPSLNLNTRLFLLGIDTGSFHEIKVFVALQGKFYFQLLVPHGPFRYLHMREESCYIRLLVLLF